MRIIADLHIAPRTVDHLRAAGHDVIRVCDALPITAPDTAIVEFAAENDRVILTQDLDFSAIIALSGKSVPSLISLRLSSSKIERVNQILEKIIPNLSGEMGRGIIVSVTDRGVRTRFLPVK